ncbi:hypothetical protein [Thermodesulfovibrio yellowstonii]|uniref:Uncharacterized protein n=1 Tax=Thermodesulfovibrio yellowstonii TaxID=28262 RepID=A0A9W6LK62_9BACT|nr:hypothetical protein [Thermodesulfovibrio islandicus]GLI52908.1 hypothetical protein TISLANDTSLP1_06010 [Thermodesulfovibrio islandicus]
MVVYYSLSNRKYWFITIERLMQIAEVLSKKSYLLHNTEAIRTTYNDWFILDENYVSKVSEIIEECASEIENEELLGDLIALKEVFDGGSVVFG